MFHKMFFYLDKIEFSIRFNYKDFRRSKNRSRFFSGSFYGPDKHGRRSLKENINK